MLEVPEITQKSKNTFSKLRFKNNNVSYAEKINKIKNKTPLVSRQLNDHKCMNSEIIYETISK